VRPLPHDVLPLLRLDDVRRAGALHPLFLAMGQINPRDRGCGCRARARQVWGTAQHLARCAGAGASAGAPPATRSTSTPATATIRALPHDLEEGPGRLPRSIAASGASGDMLLGKPVFGTRLPQT